MKVISMILRNVLLFILAFVASSVQINPSSIANTGLENAQWLLGTWESATPKRTIFETWKKVSDSAFAGKSYSVKDKDTLVFEQVQLIEKQGDLFYIPTVTGQNNGQPVSFKSKSVSASEMVFVNPEHDFPQQITYTRIAGDSLYAVVSGMVNGKLKSQKFKMRKLVH